MEVKDIRRLNMLGLLEEFKTLEALGGRVECGARTLSQIKNRTRNMGAELARKFEANLAKPTGWMDTLHNNQSPQLSIDASQLIENFEALPDGLREFIVQKTAELRVFAEALQPFVRKSLRPPREPEKYREFERDLEAEMFRVLHQDRAPYNVEKSSSKK